MDNEKLEGLKLSDEEMNAVNGGVNFEGELASAASGKNPCLHGMLGPGCCYKGKEDCPIYYESLYCIKSDIRERL